MICTHVVWFYKVHLDQDSQIDEYIVRNHVLWFISSIWDPFCSHVEQSRQFLFRETITDTLLMNPFEVTYCWLVSRTCLESLKERRGRLFHYITICRCFSDHFVLLLIKKSVLHFPFLQFKIIFLSSTTVSYPFSLSLFSLAKRLNNFPYLPELSTINLQ